jgi:RNA recognition motif-containing protein
MLLTWVFFVTDNPHEDPNIRGDAFKTLIVARLDYSADEKDLEREFGRFGPIERVCLPFPVVSLRRTEQLLTPTDPHHPRHSCPREG